MPVNSHLASLASRLVLSDVEIDGISVSISTLSSRLGAYFGDDAKGNFVFGSYHRGTILPRKADSNADVDYMIVFNSDDGQEKPQEYLDRLKNFAWKNYLPSERTESGSAIVLMLNHTKFKLVPAIFFVGCQIPSPSSSWGGWMYTDPVGDGQKIQEKDKATNYKIKPLVRLIKYWNASQGHLFTSFSLEQNIVSRNFDSCITLKDYFYAFWSDFACSMYTAQSVKDKVERTRELARQAKKYEDDDMPVAAECKIKKIVPELWD
ncbi:MAG: hypothetical protein P4L42_05415 [Desulfocapsaceae bacterium]|nr:hypothetical protein [Desulfocapsaceae bacterium]